MKTKKNRFNNILKFGVFLFGITLLLWNCEKETNNDFITESQQTISIETVQKSFKKSFSKESFKILPKEPLWEKSKAFYGGNETFYLEIPFYEINDTDAERSTSVSFDKLLAYKDADNKIVLKVIHFFALKKDNGIIDFNFITHSELIDYSGFVTFYDLHKNLLDVKQYQKGEDTNQKVKIIEGDKKENSFLSREDENTAEYTETTCTRGCWYWQYESGRVEVISCSPWICTTTTYQAAGGGGGSGTSYGTTDSVEHIDTEGLTDTKLKCLNSHLNSDGNPFIKTILGNFKGESTTNIKIESKDRVYNQDGDEVSGNTKLRNGEITIQISVNQTFTKASLEAVRTLIHEYIHADMYRKIYEIDNELHSYPNFKETYDKYESDKFEATAQHNTMADLYIIQMRDALKNYHKTVLVGDYNYLTNNGTNPLPDNFYEALAWRGLKNQGVEAYSNLTDEKKQDLEDSLTQHYHDTTTNCPDN